METRLDVPLGIAKYAVPVQVVWAILAALWNMAGVVLIARGEQPLGPTASVAGAVVLLVLAFAYPLTVRRWPILYLLASVIGGLAGIGAVVNAFIADPALWPSEFWRYAGVILNGIGFCAAIIGITSVVRQRWFDSAK